MKKKVGFTRFKSFYLQHKLLFDIVYLVLLIILPQLVSSDFIVRIIVTSMIYSLASMGNMVIVGYCGLLTCGHGAFYAHMSRRYWR